MNVDLDDIEKEIKTGLSRVRPTWAQFERESEYYLNRGHKFIPSREVESGTDKQNRPKLGLHFISRIIGELAKGLYTQPGPARKVTNSVEADALVQGVVTEHWVNMVLHKADSYTWLHGVCAVQVTPYVDTVYRRHTGESVIRGKVPVQFRVWTADQFVAFCDDQDPSYPVAVITRSQVMGRERLQMWTDSEVRTYMAITSRGTNVANKSRQFELDPASSGSNPFGVIPFSFSHNEDPSDGFYTPGLGYSLCNTCFWLDQVLSDLTQAVEVFCIPEKYSRNLSISSRLIHRPGDPIDLIERDPSKDADVFFRQPKLETESVWLHIENVINEALVGLDIPIRVEVQSTSQPESGIALIIRRQPLVDKWKERQELFKWFERYLWRTACRVAVASLNDPSLVGASSMDEADEIIDQLEVEADFPENSFPIPSQEKDMSDDWELEHGMKSRIQIVQERFGKTRAQAIEHIKQVAEDEKEIGTVGTIPAPQPGLKVVGDTDVYEKDFSASAENSKAIATTAPGMQNAPPESGGNVITAVNG